MTRQFGRRARAVIGLADEAFEVQGLRMVFEVRKSKLGQFPNGCELRIYNLASDTRAKLEEHAKRLSLFAGYGEAEQLIFTGQIRHTVPERERSEWVSVLYCGDAYREQQEATISRTYARGTPPRRIIEDVASSFGLVETPLLQDVDGLAGVLRAMTLSGASKEAMNELTETWGLDWSIVDGRVEVSGRDRSIGSEVTVVSPETGLIGQPVVTDRGIEFQTLLNPRIRVKRLVQILSRAPVARVANIFYRPEIPKLSEGVYVVGEVVHSGDTYGRDWTSSVKTFRTPR